MLFFRLLDLSELLCIQPTPESNIKAQLRSALVVRLCFAESGLYHATSSLLKLLSNCLWPSGSFSKTDKGLDASPMVTRTFGSSLNVAQSVYIKLRRLEVAPCPLWNHCQFNIVRTLSILQKEWPLQGYYTEVDLLPASRGSVLTYLPGILIA